MTRDRARKKPVRAQMAASGEPYSVAARKLGSTRAADQAAAPDEAATRVEATLAASTARFEIRKQVTADPATAPARDQRRLGPFRRLAGGAVRTARDHMVPAQARARRRTAGSGMARGIIEPSARRFQHHQVRQDLDALALAMVITRPELGRTPNAHVEREDPLELLIRLRSVTAARYAEDEAIRKARCRKIAVAANGSTAVFTVWVDGEHVRQIQAVARETRQRVIVTVLATTTVTAQLWDFGVPFDSGDWPPLPPAHCPRTTSRPAPGPVWPGAAAGPSDFPGRPALGNRALPGPARPKASDSPDGARAEPADRHHPDVVAR